MHTEYNQTKKNKKALLLLLVLGVFGFVAFKYTNVKDIVAKDSKTEASTCATTVVDNSYESSDIFLNISESGVITDVTPQKVKTGEVLGSECSNNPLNTYKADSACTIPGLSSGSASPQGWVSTKATVDMVSINVPVRLLSGIYSVKDSNRQITLDTPTYKPAGEQFDDKQILVNNVPGEAGEPVKTEIVETSIQQKAYSTMYILNTAVDEGSGELVISEYADNDCGETCNNFANINPFQSNMAAAFIKSKKFDPPNQEEETASSTKLTITGECEDIDPLNISDDAYRNECFNVWKAIVGTLGSLFPSSDWTNCDPEGEGCINSEDIAVKMSPMFDDTNSYTTIRNKSAMSPESASLYESVYVITPCLANVAKKLANVKCIWDMSYLFDERKAAEYDDAGESNTPTLEQYKIFLNNESIRREDPLLPM